MASADVDISRPRSADLPIVTSVHIEEMIHALLSVIKITVFLH